LCPTCGCVCVEFKYKGAVSQLASDGRAEIADNTYPYFPSHDNTECLQNNINAKIDPCVGDLNVNIEIIDQVLPEVRKLWHSGWSLADKSCSAVFAERMRQFIDVTMQNLNTLKDDRVASSGLKEKRTKLFKLRRFLAAVNCDTPESFGKWLVNECSNDADFVRAIEHIGYAVGDASLRWQQRLFKMLMRNLSPYYVNFSGEIGAEERMPGIILSTLGRVLWRSENLIFKISKSSLQILMDVLLKELGRDIFALRRKPSKEDVQRRQNRFDDRNEADISKDIRRFQTQALSQHLQLLLAMLRLRGRSDFAFVVDNQNVLDSIVKIMDGVSRLGIRSAYLNRYVEPSLVAAYEIGKDDAKFQNIIKLIRSFLPGDRCFCGRGTI
jgi:hypothetical protein